MQNLRDIFIIVFFIGIFSQTQAEDIQKNRIGKIEGENSSTTRQIPMPKDMRSSQDFSWFPDSQRIVMLLVQRIDKNDSRSVIAVVEVASGKIKILTKPNIKHGNPVCSPDSKTLLFTERNNDVWIVNADGSELKQLTSGPGARSRPKWSPDGNLIAYVDTSKSELRLMDANGNNQRILAKLVSMTGYNPIGDSDDFYDWSPDGKSIVYAYRPIPPEGEHITYDGGIHPYQLWIVNIDGSAKHCITSEDISCGHPIWSPNKRHILYESVYKWIVSKRSTDTIYPKQNIWMLDLVEKKKKQLTNSGRIREYAISPDGEKIVYSTEDDKSIFIADCL